MALLMTRTRVVVFVLVAMGPVTATAQKDQPVGIVVEAVPKVTGRPQCNMSELGELKKESPVCVGMEIETFAEARAQILINTDLPKRKGFVILGPATKIQLTKRTVTLARTLEQLSWLIKLGQFLLALPPRDPNDPADKGECLIYTAAGDLVQLTGTIVAVEVAQDGTLTVWVIDGTVKVKAPAGDMWVPVSARYRTRVRPDGKPEPPVLFGLIDGPPQSLMSAFYQLLEPR